MKTKKMLLIYNSSLDLDNGSNTHVLELSKNLSTNTDLLLVTPKSKNSNAFHFTKEINVFDQKKVDSISYQIIYQIGLFKTLLTQCLKSKPDIIYERLCGWSFLPAEFSKIFKIPYVTEINGLMIDELKMDNYPHHYVKISMWNERRNYNVCKKVVCVTAGIKNGIIKLYHVPEEKIAVISNGANTDLFFPRNSEDSKREVNLEEDKRYICFVGNLAPWQGIEFLIKASKQLLEVFPKIRFLIIGDGSMKDELIALTKKLNVADFFIFTGKVPYSLVPTYINASDVCVAPFVMERNNTIGLSPLKIYEYLACGKPVVASDIPGINEILEDSGGGIAVTPEDSLCLAEGIKLLLENNELQKRMGLQARKYIIENCTWPKVAERVNSVCREAICSNSLI